MTRLPLAIVALVLGLALVLVPSSPAMAQEEGAFERVPVRVTSSAAGGPIVIDRGKTDGMAVGDLVLLQPREGGDRWATVVQVDERTGIIEMHDKSYVPALGVRGDLLVPRTRLGGESEETRDSEGGETGAAEHPGWKNKDDVWSQNEPLLARVKPVRPEERSPLVTGFVYASVDLNWLGGDGAGSDSAIRTGTDVTAENPFGLGGRLRFAGELNQKSIDDPDEDEDDSDLHFRLDRLSYAFGGTRWADMRWELGRFLQSGMPEFGYLDGLEWGHRSRGGDRIGASVGFMPEPDADFATGDDFQVAAFYQWVSDESERFSVAGGYQKSFHHGSADRDLVVARVRYLPLEKGWDFHGTAWVDFYGSGDNAKDAAVELTQAVVSASRIWEGGDGVDFSYRHLAFPEIEREEFEEVTEEELADNREDRLGAEGWTWTSRHARFHGEAGVWDDEDDAGGDLEAGVEVRDAIIDSGRADLTAFGTIGDFEKLVGGRLSFGRYTSTGSWDVAYELTQRHEDGFSEDRDDILQHRVRASASFYEVFGCTLSIYGQATFFDSEAGFSTGFYLQRSF